MEIRFEKIDSANVQVSAVLPKNAIDQEIDTIANKMSKEMKIDGFRKGKVPVSIVKRKYSDQIKQDAEREIFQQMIDNAVKSMELPKEKLIGEPFIKKYDDSDKTNINIEFILGLKPEIKIDGYKDFIPEINKTEVKQEEIDERIKGLAKSSAPFDDITEERGLQEKDYAVLDFEGFIDGNPLENGKAENFTLEIGSHQFIAGFEENLIDMKIGETREFEVTFPENYHQKAIAGKPAKFVTTLKKIQVKNIKNIDDEFAKSIMPSEENATLEKLNTKVREQIETEKLNMLYANELKPALVDALVKNLDFDVPQPILEKEIDLLLKGRVENLPKEKIDELSKDLSKVEEMKDHLREEATKSVKVTFIVDALSKAENIDVTQEELTKTIYNEAMQMGQKPEALLEFYNNQGVIPALRMAIMEDKLLEKLLNSKLEESNK